VHDRCGLRVPAAKNRFEGKHADGCRFLPPHKFSRKVNDGRVFYVYPDPTLCGCLYVGDQTAYTTYRNNVFQKNLADEQAMTANEMSMDNWDWGPWGGPPYGWYY
jgi:hypothetical protein